MLTRLSAAELSRKLRDREVSAREVAQTHLDEISRRDPDLGCFLTVEPEKTLSWADEAQKKLDDGSGGPLCGVPIALKDNMSTKGMRTTCASKILENYVPPYDGTVIEKLHEAGCVPLGK